MTVQPFYMGGDVHTDTYQGYRLVFLYL
jgi:hypothetical protein